MVDITTALSGITPQIWNMIIIAALCLGAFIAILLFVLWWTKRLKYDFPVTIFSIRRDGTLVVTSDLGALKRKKGEECFILKNKKAYLPPPPLDFGTLSEKGGTHFYVIQTGVNEFRYAIPEIKNPEKILLSPDQRDIMAWNVYAQELMREMFDIRSWLKKMAPMLVVALAVVAVIVIMAIISKNLSAAIELGNTVVNKAAALGSATINQGGGAAAPF